ncbi:hypothetical protein CYMTET_44505 [Cymbomonas tetramitiformis]|uniref:Uncharacterized protein n=1 Tax=Cymbomonas tetramitiformis TaxID=36881 RepID=A0AAE0EYZ1_9CHLO|nr:hypothetical protein CYMTET_44505 [Cymbomonas tetramitiformis]
MLSSDSEGENVPLAQRKKVKVDSSAGELGIEPRTTIPKKPAASREKAESKPDVKGGSSISRNANNKIEKDEKSTPRNQLKQSAAATKKKEQEAAAKVKTEASVSKNKSKPKDTVDTAKKEKKQYQLTGQKRDPPEENDSLRKFYSSLRKQRPNSEMAEVWMMEHGLLSPQESQRAFDDLQDRKRQLKEGLEGVAGSSTLNEQLCLHQGTNYAIVRT